jgi:hypothetical protein
MSTHDFSTIAHNSSAALAVVSHVMNFECSGAELEIKYEA